MTSIPAYNFDGNFDDFFEILFKGDRLKYGDWFEWNCGWWKQGEDPEFLFVTYEEMSANIRDVIHRIARFLNKSLSQEVIEEIIKYTSFKEMKNNKMVNYEFLDTINQEKSAFMRSGVVGDWRKHMSEEQVKYCETYFENKVQETGVQLPKILL